MIRFACMAALACIGAGEAFACDVPLIRVLHNQTVDGTMQARSGRPCWIRLRHASGMSAGTAIVQRPANGTATAAGQSVAYQSRPGYVGSDSFTYARHGRDRWGKRTVSTVRVAVTVQ